MSVDDSQIPIGSAQERMKVVLQFQKRIMKAIKRLRRDDANVDPEVMAYWIAMALLEDPRMLKRLAGIAEMDTAFTRLHRS